MNSRDKKRNNWDTALGINKMDNFKPDEEFKELIEKEINGEITTEDIIKLIVEKYKNNICSSGTNEKSESILRSEHMNKEKIDKILNDVDADFSLEGMPLTDENKERIRACLSGKNEFGETVKGLVDKYKKVI